jgi:hypothetical protein
MLCDHCHGKGVVRREGGPEPCAECGGRGVLHCCEGLQAQPEGPDAVNPCAEGAHENPGRARNG